MLPIYDSSQRGLPAIEELVELWRYRNLVVQTVRRNIVVRYKRSVLGIAWTMLNPLGMALILTFVFSKMFGSTSAYPAYVLSGIIAWNFFSQATSDSMANLIWGGGLIKRIYIPRTVFAVGSLGTGLVNLALALVPLAIIMLFTGIPIRPAVLFLPVPVLFLTMFSLGIGLLLSTFALYFPDVAEMYNILLMAWFYLSPVVWTENMLPQEFAWIVRLNPMYYLIRIFRQALYFGTVASWKELALAGTLSVLVLLLGWIFFASKADEFAYRV
jgi:ABC-2 type transport system permease protein